MTAPTPNSLPIGSGARNAGTLSAGTTRRPSGLSMSDAIFAAILVGAMPTDATSASSRRTRSLIASPTARGGPSRRSLPVRSTKASSNDSPSTVGEKSARIAKNPRDASA